MALHMAVAECAIPPSSACCCLYSLFMKSQGSEFPQPHPESTHEDNAQCPQARLEFPQARPEFPQARLEFPQARPEFPQPRPEFPQARLEFPQPSPEFPQPRLKSQPGCGLLVANKLQKSHRPPQLVALAAVKWAPLHGVNNPVNYGAASTVDNYN